MSRSRVVLPVPGPPCKEGRHNGRGRAGKGWAAACNKHGRPHACGHMRRDLRSQPRHFTACAPPHQQQQGGRDRALHLVPRSVVALG